MFVPNQPLVSVIIPNYNHASFLEQRIQSILNQSYTHFELIMLDDASTDHSSEVLNRYANDPHVTCIEINTVNSGSPFIQWNKGLEKANGEYVWIAESDDFAQSSFLEVTVAAMEAHPHSAICFTGATWIDPQGNELPDDWDKWTKKQLSSPHRQGVFEGTTYATRNLYWHNYIYNASGVLFRRAYAHQIGKQYCAMRYCGDWLFWAEMTCKGSVIEIYQKINYFRQHPKRTSFQAVSTGNSLKEDMKVVHYIERNHLHIGRYKRLLRQGAIYKKIKRLPVSEEVKTDLFNYYHSLFGEGQTAYWVERTNKVLSGICPWITTAKRERIY